MDFLRSSKVWIWNPWSGFSKLGKSYFKLPTWLLQQLPQEYADAFAELERLTSPDDLYRNYRERLAETRKGEYPVLPNIGGYNWFDTHFLELFLRGISITGASKLSLSNKPRWASSNSPWESTHQLGENEIAGTFLCFPENLARDTLHIWIYSWIASAPEGLAPMGWIPAMDSIRTNWTSSRDTKSEEIKAQGLETASKVP